MSGIDISKIDKQPFNDLIMLRDRSRDGEGFLESILGGGDNDPIYAIYTRDAEALKTRLSSDAYGINAIVSRDKTHLVLNFADANRVALLGGALVNDRKALKGITFFEGDGNFVASKDFGDRKHFEEVCNVLDQSGANYTKNDPTNSGGKTGQMYEVHLKDERAAAIVLLSGGSVLNAEPYKYQFAPGIDAELVNTGRGGGK